jgi:hypothetical protein
MNGSDRLKDFGVAIGNNINNILLFIVVEANMVFIYMLPGGG